MDDPYTNLFDLRGNLRQDLFGRILLRHMPDAITNLEDIADVFILKFILDGLEENEQDSQITQSSWLGRIWRYLRSRVATNSRITHWAVEVRGDLYETFRHKEYHLPWDWRGTMRMTAKGLWESDPKRNLVERERVGTTALGSTEIAERSKINLSFERG
jgi:hypothetical protein